MSIKAPNPVDKYVGSRVRMRRIMLGMSQEKLGEALGLTFQQVQKYEKGTNRVGASRLQQISEILHVPVRFCSTAGRAALSSRGLQRRLFAGLRFGFSRDLRGLALTRAFTRITDAKCAAASSNWSSRSPRAKAPTSADFRFHVAKPGPIDAPAGASA